MHASDIQDEPFDAIRRCLHQERRRTVAERDAFEAFADRVRDVQPVTATTAPTPLVDRTASGSLESIRDAYRQTVMAVPHYEEEYGQGYATDVADELGPDVAAALTGTRDLDERTKRAVLLATAGSRRRREALLEVLGAERASVDAAAPRLRPIADELESLSSVDLGSESFGALDAYRVRTDALAERCDAVAAARQADLRDHRTAITVPCGAAALPRYLYGGFDDTFPLLAYVAALGQWIDELRIAVSRAVSRYEGDYRLGARPGCDRIVRPDGEPISR